jgi:hypothetical protein
MDPKEILIYPDPKYSGNSDLFSTIIKLRNYLELKIISDIIKIRYRNPVINIIDCNAINSNDLKKNCLGMTPRNNAIEEDNTILPSTTKISEKWYNYGDLPLLLNFEGINLGKIIQGDLNNKLYYIMDTLRDLEHYHPNIPSSIYVQSDVFLKSKIIYNYFTNKKLNPNYIEPSIFRKIGCYLRSREISAQNSNIFTNIQLYRLDSPRKNSKYKILIDVPCINHLNVIVPIVDELLSQKIPYEIYFLGNRSDILKKYDRIVPITLPQTDDKKMAKKIRNLRKYYKELESDLEFKQIFTCCDIPLWDIIKSDFERYIKKDIIAVLHDLGRFKTIVSYIKPDLIIFGDDRTFKNRGHALLSKKLKIPLLEVQHGIFPILWPMAPPLSNKIAIGGTYYRDYYSRYPSQETQVVVTGWPKFDKYTKMKNDLENSGVIKHDLIKILFATQPIDFDFNTAVVETLGMSRHMSDKITVIIKPHPTESTLRYNEICKKYSNILLYNNRTDISNLIVSSDIIIIVSSTVGLEAAVFDKPIICLNPRNEDSIYVSGGIALNVTNLNDLIPAINEILYDKEIQKKLADARDKFVYNHAYLQDGFASQRVIDIIRNMT